jgi:hypothetical protein
MTSTAAATSEMDRLDQLSARAFDGFLVRKDLVRNYSCQYPVSPRNATAGPSARRAAAFTTEEWRDFYARAMDNARSGRQAQPAAARQHAGVGAQGIAEEPRRPGGIQPFAVGGVRLPFTLGEVLHLAASAVLS